MPAVMRNRRVPNQPLTRGSDCRTLIVVSQPITNPLLRFPVGESRQIVGIFQPGSGLVDD
jgi:hypothetical protein